MAFMMFTVLETWLLGWIILISVLGNLALVFSFFEKTEKFSEPMIFITMAIVIPLLMVLWVLDTIFKKADSRRKKKREDVLSKFIDEKKWVEHFIYLDNLTEGPDWIEDAFKNKQIFYFGPDLIVKTIEGDVLVKLDDVILKYEDNTLGVLPKDLTPKVSRDE